MQQPSGAKPRFGSICSTVPGSTVGAIWPHTRRSPSDPSAAIVNAVRRPANVSPTISVSPSITVPLGNQRSSASTWTEPSGSTRTQARARRIGERHQVEAEVADVGAAELVHRELVEVTAAVLGQVGVDA